MTKQNTMQYLIEQVILAALVIQNIDLLRMVRLGPFSVIDFVVTYWLAYQLAVQTRTWHFHLWNTYANFMILLGLGEGLHALLGLNTPLLQWSTVVHEIFHYYLTYYTCLASYYLGISQPCLDLLFN